MCVAFCTRRTRSHLLRTISFAESVFLPGSLCAERCVGVCVCCVPGGNVESDLIFLRHGDVVATQCTEPDVHL